MISIENETVLSFAQAARELPLRRQGKRTHTATLYRWANPGLRGVCLETIQVGGTLCTSLEALQRFFDRLSIRESPGGPHPRQGARRTLTAKRLREAGFNEENQA